MTDNRVTILLSTYCGENFIEEQLDSLFSQKGVNVRILIRDDGSPDNGKTVKRIEKFITQHPGKITLIKGKNLGWKKSFMELMNYAKRNCSDYEWFAFCDQDDIWLPEKLLVAINALQSIGTNSKPKLYSSNLYYYKNGRNYGKIRKKQVIPTHKNCLVRNYATGCSVVFNHRLLEMIASEMPRVDIAHDYWAYMIAVLCGEVIVDDDAYILYRQHDNNQIGSKGSFFEVWKRRIHEMANNAVNVSRQETAYELRRIFGKYMDEEALLAVGKLADYKKSLFRRISLFIDNGYSLNKVSNNFWLKLRILFGKV